MAEDKKQDHQDHVVVVESKLDDSFFEQTHQDLAYVLVDASGSTLSNFAPMDKSKNAPTVFRKMGELLVRHFPFQKYRFLFWNSANASRQPPFKYITGFHIYPYVVAQKDVASLFAIFEKTIDGHCLTDTTLPFVNMPNEWKQSGHPVILLTDGQMHECCNRTLLAQTLRQLPFSFVIMTVENTVRNFNNQSELSSAAGCDLFKLVQHERLTNKINKFISFTPESMVSPNSIHVHEHINQLQAPPGFVPFRDRYFSETKMPQFLCYLQRLLQFKTEDEQLDIIHNLGPTIVRLGEKKPLSFTQNFIGTLLPLFSPNLSQTIIRQALMDGIERLKQQTAQLVTDFKSQLKKTFKEADQTIRTNVKEALGSHTQFVSFPLNGHILTGPYRLMNASVVCQGFSFAHAGYTSSIPCFGLDSKQTEFEEQCLRQWTRQVIGQMHHVKVVDDLVIYLIMGYNALVQVSPGLSEAIKQAYRDLTMVMLRKKNAHSQSTEYEYWCSGSTPWASVSRTGFVAVEGLLSQVGHKLGILATPQQLWLFLCQQVTAELFQAQSVHFAHEIKFMDQICEQIQSRAGQGYQAKSIGMESIYDYQCIVTMDDLSHEGGFAFQPHTTPLGHPCAPTFLVSAHAYHALLPSQKTCPVCYADLVEKDFQAVGPRVDALSPEELAVLANDYFQTHNQTHSQAHNHDHKNRNEEKKEDKNSGYDDDWKEKLLRRSNNQASGNAGPRMLILLRGTVGSGKTTLAAKIKQQVEEEKKGLCFVEGTDKYCVEGKTPAEGVKCVERALQQAVSQANQAGPQLVVVVLDVCNEQNKLHATKFFKTDFAGWIRREIFPNLSKEARFESSKDPSKLQGYLAWSLNNVLSRPAASNKSSFYLNPEQAGEATCVRVHKGKASQLFPKCQCPFWTCPVDRQALAVEAAKYQAWVEQQPEFEFQL